MNPAPVYHVNRFKANESLVGETSIIEKSLLNLVVLEEVIKMDLPSRAKYQAINRIVEVDFLARLFNRVRYLRAKDKQPFFDVFYEMIKILNKYDLSVEEFVTNKKLKVILKLIFERRHEDLNEYVYMLTRGEKAPKYIKDNLVHFRLPKVLKEFSPITEEMFAVYSGAREEEGILYETIKLYTNKINKIIKVVLTEMKNEINEKEIDFIVKDNIIYIKSDDLVFENNNFNIRIIYDDYKSYIVNASYPSAVGESRLNRQSYKAEFIDHEFDDYYTMPEVSYLNYIKNFAKNLLAINEISKYENVNFEKESNEKIPKGSIIKVKDYVRDKVGRTQLITDKDEFIFADFNKLNLIDPKIKENYIISIPRKVRIRKKCNVYKDVGFKTEPIETLWPGTFVDVVNIICTNKGTPRLVTSEGLYITANKEFVKIIE